MTANQIKYPPLDTIFKDVSDVADLEKKLTDFLVMQVSTDVMRGKYFYEVLYMMGDPIQYEKTGQYPSCIDGIMQKFDEGVNKAMPEILKLYGFDC